ncbi:MAG: GMC oxidoreductase [Alphaproteobacteria bacterium]
MTTETYDAIVIGSGISGGWAAKELTEKGLRVLMLERGKEMPHGEGYVGEHVPTWEEPFYGKEDRDLWESDYEIQKKSYAFSDTTKHFFNNDRLNPYQQETPFVWTRTDVVGGRSLVWGRQVYRWSEEDFKANEKDGHGVAWPIGYDDIKDWYSYVERFIGVSGQAEGLPQLPDGEFLPPMEMFGIEKTVKERVEKRLPHIRVTMGRVAILTQEHNGREACHYCGPCHRGCSSGSYFSTQSSTLPAAEATGNLTLRPHSVVEKLELDAETGKISAVHVIDARTKEKMTFSARLIFLNASTIGSTQILLNSATDGMPDGMANSSGTLGRYLMDHHDGLGALGLFADNLDSYFYGNRPNATYIPRFRNVGGQDADANFLRGFGYQAMGLRMGWQTMVNLPGFGAAYKDRMIKPGPWAYGMGGFGECLPYADNRVTLDRQNLDRFGIPQAKIRFEWGENEINMRQDLANQGEKILRAAGAVFTIKSDEMSIPGMGVHEMGTARMGKDSKTSVLNKWNQAHDVPNLFITDGSAMTSASCVNPSITYMALTARAADYAVKEFRKGTL